MGERLLEIKQTATDDATIREFEKFNRCEKHVVSSINAKIVHSCSEYHDEVENIATKSLLQYSEFHFDDSDNASSDANINCCKTPYACQKQPELIIDEFSVLPKQQTGSIQQHNQMTVYCSHKSITLYSPENGEYEGDFGVMHDEGRLLNDERPKAQRDAERLCRSLVKPEPGSRGNVGIGGTYIW